MKRGRDMSRTWSFAVAMLAVAIVVPGASAEPQPAPVACDGWQWVKVPRAADVGDLNDIAVLSPDDAWAVGDLGDDALLASLAIHWNGEVWERTPFPTVASLTSVATTGSGEVWAVGSRGQIPEVRSGHLFTARWSGDRWVRVPTGITTPGTLLDVVSIPGTDELWAVGYWSGGGPLILHWTGKAWRDVAVPVERRDTQLLGIVAFEEQAWAVGHVGNQMLALRWNGQRWRQVDTPPGGASSIDGVGPSRVWAVGSTPYPHHPAIFRWNGDRWRTTWTGRGEGGLSDVVVTGEGDAVAVGTTYRGMGSPTLVELRSGAWLRTALEADTGYLTSIAGTTEDLWITWTSSSSTDPPFFGTYHRC